jgi:hypothetical protein
MLGTSCNDKNCSGWLVALAVGAIMYTIVLVNFLNEVL